MFQTVVNDPLLFFLFAHFDHFYDMWAIIFSFKVHISHQCFHYQQLLWYSLFSFGLCSHNHSLNFSHKITFNPKPYTISLHSESCFKEIMMQFCTSKLHFFLMYHSFLLHVIITYAFFCDWESQIYLQLLKDIFRLKVSIMKTFSVLTTTWVPLLLFKYR